MVAKYGGRVKFVSENFGASKLAERFGVTRYPAVFVGDVLVARPRDFGFVGEGESTGRYAPWRNADNQARFKADLTRMVDLALAGKLGELARAAPAAATVADEIAALPDFGLSDLAGGKLTSETLRDKAVLVEFWATWCPPCQSTLEWLGSLKRKYGDRLEVVALAVESPEEGIRKTAAKLDRGLRVAIADGPTAAAFGGITAVPTLFLFDASGKATKIIYGAPPDLHEQIEKALGPPGR